MSGKTGLRVVPALTVALFMLPIGAGLVGTLLPAFGYLPAIGGHALSLDPWRRLFAYPGFATALATTLFTGVAATLLSTLLAVGLCAVAHGTPLARRASAWVAPVLSTPHAAIAIGVAFLIAPSGWIARALSPWLTGWTLPPDVATVGHPSGWPLIACLVLKEMPYLVLMIASALHQVPAAPQLAVARSLGYGRVESWLKVVLPQIYPQIRLPIFAVLAFSLSVVDVALILGPGNPPTLAVLAVRWFADPAITQYFPAAAAATLSLAIVIVAVAAWHVSERAVAFAGRRWIARGRRHGAATVISRIACALAVGSFVVSAFAVAGMALWSVSEQWRFPAALPDNWTLANWSRQMGAIAAPFSTTLLLGALASAIAVILAAGCLENEALTRRRAGIRSLWLLYVPLLVPQIAFLFGAQVLLIRARLDGTVFAVLWAHLVFVVPYVFLSLADSWRALDPRYARAAASLGASPWRVFARIKLPLLLGPLLIAAAVGFAVSVGQYLPTLFAGNGRVATLTTDAVTLAAGADRRVIGVYAALQALLPCVAYLAAIACGSRLRTAPTASARVTQ
ncbi:MAG TPA: ABC transporter permease subunit [Casimicrobiaceae bacterium]|nr:ABC transporter permease subunit [Casimicrobiaceae bacterium]